MKFNLNRALAIAKKETFHILRDPFTLGLAILLPVLLVSVFGLSIEFNMKNISLAVYDGDNTQTSRKVVKTFASSNYFIIQHLDDPGNASHIISAERAKGALIIPPQFEKDIMSGRTGSAQIMVDGADNTTVGPIMSYIGRIQQRLNKQIQPECSVNPVDIKTRYLYNPELSSPWFIVPGLIVVVLSIFSVLLTALTIAREWEYGSMELILSTPARPFEIIFGKLIPYCVLGLIAISFIYLVARLGFGVPFSGNHAVFILSCLIFLVTYLAQGLVISVVTRQQQLAMQLAMVSGMLPSLLLSGFIFPIESMPKFFQYFTVIFPARWFMYICRDIFLKGSTLWQMKIPFLALTGLCLLLILVATKKFKKDLEP